MKSIKAKFHVLQEKNVGHGAYISLVGAVKWQGYTRDTIGRNFTELMPKEDFAKMDRERLIDELVWHTKCIVEHVSESREAPRRNL